MHFKQNTSAWLKAVMSCLLHLINRFPLHCCSLIKNIRPTSHALDSIYISLLSSERAYRQRHTSSSFKSRRIKKKKKLHSFIFALFNAQSVKGNDMACKRCEISTFIKDNGVDLFFVTETWLSAQGDEAKTAELAPSGFDLKSFSRQSRSRGGGIATVYKSTLGSNITFKTNFDFTHTSFEVVQASITLQHNTLHFFCLYRPPPNRRSNLTDYVY